MTDIAVRAPATTCRRSGHQVVGYEDQANAAVQSLRRVRTESPRVGLVRREPTARIELGSSTPRPHNIAPWSNDDACHRLAETVRTHRSSIGSAPFNGRQANDVRPHPLAPTARVTAVAVVISGDTMGPTTESAARSQSRPRGIAGPPGAASGPAGTNGASRRRSNSTHPTARLVTRFGDATARRGARAVPLAARADLRLTRAWRCLRRMSGAIQYFVAEDLGEPQELTPPSTRWCSLRKWRQVRERLAPGMRPVHDPLVSRRVGTWLETAWSAVRQASSGEELSSGGTGSTCSERVVQRWAGGQFTWRPIEVRSIVCRSTKALHALGLERHGVLCRQRYLRGSDGQCSPYRVDTVRSCGRTSRCTRCASSILMQQIRDYNEVGCRAMMRQTASCLSRIIEGKLPASGAGCATRLPSLSGNRGQPACSAAQRRRTYPPPVVSAGAPGSDSPRDPRPSELTEPQLRPDRERPPFRAESERLQGNFRGNAGAGPLQGHRMESRGHARAQNCRMALRRSLVKPH